MRKGHSGQQEAWLCVWQSVHTLASFAGHCNSSSFKSASFSVFGFFWHTHHSPSSKGLWSLVLLRVLPLLFLLLSTPSTSVITVVVVCCQSLLTLCSPLPLCFLIPFSTEHKIWQQVFFPFFPFSSCCCSCPLSFPPSPAPLFHTHTALLCLHTHWISKICKETVIRCMVCLQPENQRLPRAGSWCGGRATPASRRSHCTVPRPVHRRGDTAASAAAAAAA